MKQLKYGIVMLVSALFIVACGSGKKAAYTEAEMEAFKNLLESKSYVFKGRWANPMASQSLNAIANAGLLAPGNTVGRIDILNSNNTMEFKGDSIIAQLPYFGERRLGGGYNLSNTGVNFKNIPTDFELVFDEKRKGYVIDFSINNGTENYNVSGIFYPNKTANIFVNSTQRMAIRYSGDLVTAGD